MLNPFPIQFLSLFAYFILRVFVSLFLFVTVSRQLRRWPRLGDITRRRWWYLIAGYELILSVAFLMGIYTQYAALGLLVFSIWTLIRNRSGSSPLYIANSAAFLLLGISISLFITGAGVLAVDLPI